MYRVREIETWDDVVEFSTLGGIMHEESDYQDIKLSFPAISEFAVQVISQPERSVFNAWGVWKADALVGMMAGVCHPMFFTRSRVAEDVVLYVTPSSRGSRAALLLMDAFEKWALSYDAKHIRINLSTGVNSVSAEKFLNKLGYNTVGAVVRKIP